MKKAAEHAALEKKRAKEAAKKAAEAKVVADRKRRDAARALVRISLLL